MGRFNINDLMMGMARFSGSELVWRYDTNEFQRFFHDMSGRFPALFEESTFSQMDAATLSRELADHYRLALKAGLIQSVNGNGKVYFSPACSRFYDAYTCAKFSGKGSKSLVEALKEASIEFACRFSVAGK